MTDKQKSHMNALRACNTGRILSGVEERFVRDLHEDDEMTRRQAELLLNLWGHSVLRRQMAPGVIPDVDAGGGAA